jgi:hypothetical protein
MRGLLLSLGLTATALAAPKDTTEQIVIQCRCIDKYSQWMCEAFWWLLC